MCHPSVSLCRDPLLPGGSPDAGPEGAPARGVRAVLTASLTSSLSELKAMQSCPLRRVLGSMEPFILGKDRLAKREIGLDEGPLGPTLQATHVSVGSLLALSAAALSPVAPLASAKPTLSLALPTCLHDWPLSACPSCGLWTPCGCGPPPLPHPALASNLDFSDGSLP